MVKAAFVGISRNPGKSHSGVPALVQGHMINFQQKLSLNPVERQQ